MNSVKVEMFARAVVLLGALNWLGIATFNTNLVQKLLGKADVAVYIIVGMCAIYLATDLGYFLPFLSPSAIPDGALSPKVPDGATVSVQVYAPPNSKVMYWAAESDRVAAETPRIAYKEYENAGVAVSNALGKALLKVRPPVGYQVGFGPFRRTIKPHIHYRVGTTGGIFGRVQTVFIPEP